MTRTSWRARLPDLAALLDDPRVHSVLIEPSGATDVRDAAGEVLDLWLAPLPPSVLRAVAKQARELDDESFVFTAVPGVAGPVVQVRRRAGEDQLGLPVELGHLVERALALGASVLVTAPTAAARARGVAMLARAASKSRRVLALPEARLWGTPQLTPAAAELLGQLDHVLVVAGELSGRAAEILASGGPCVAAAPGLEVETAVARLAGQQVAASPGLAHGATVAWIARRFELVLELDAQRVVSLAELHAGPDGALTVLRLVRRLLDGAYEVDLLGSRLEHLLGTELLRPKLSLPGVAATAVARPPRADAEAHARLRTSELSRGPVIVRGSPSTRPSPRKSELPPPPARSDASRALGHTTSTSRPPTSASSPPRVHTPTAVAGRLTSEVSPSRLPGRPPSRPHTPTPLQLSPASALTPLVEPPHLAQSPARAAVSGPSGIREPAADVAEHATAAGAPLGRVGLYDLPDLTADQLVSQSFIVDVNAPEEVDEASAVGELAFDGPTASGEGRAPLERLSTEVALGGATGLGTPMPQVIGFGGSDETMQIPATMLRPPSALRDEAGDSEPPPEPELASLLDEDAAVSPVALDEEDRAGRTAMGSLTAEELEPLRPSTPGRAAPRIRRAKP